MDSSTTGQNAGPEANPANQADPADPADAVAALADDIGQSLAVARVLARQGRELALTGLDQRIGMLCAQTLDLGPGPARALRPRLAALLAGLDALHDLLDGAP